MFNAFADIRDNITAAQVLHPGYSGPRFKEKSEEDPRSPHHVHFKPQVTVYFVLKLKKRLSLSQCQLL